MGSTVEIMVHVGDPAAKAALQARIESLPGVVSARLHSAKPRFLFVSYDPAVFDARRIAGIARDLGTPARIVGA